LTTMLQGTLPRATAAVTCRLHAQSAAHCLVAASGKKTLSQELPSGNMLQFAQQIGGWHNTGVCPALQGFERLQRCRICTCRVCHKLTLTLAASWERVRHCHHLHHHWCPRCCTTRHCWWRRRHPLSQPSPFRGAHMFMAWISMDQRRWVCPAGKPACLLTVQDTSTAVAGVEVAQRCIFMPNAWAALRLDPCCTACDVVPTAADPHETHLTGLAARSSPCSTVGHDTHCPGAFYPVFQQCDRRPLYSPCC
jgi:hypothetical protein